MEILCQVEDGSAGRELSIPGALSDYIVNALSFGKQSTVSVGFERVHTSVSTLFMHLCLGVIDSTSEPHRDHSHAVYCRSAPGHISTSVCPARTSPLSKALAKPAALSRQVNEYGCTISRSSRFLKGYRVDKDTCSCLAQRSGPLQVST